LSKPTRDQLILTVVNDDNDVDDDYNLIRLLLCSN